MKTSKQMETELTESGINNRLSHRSFLQHLSSGHGSTSRKVVRNVDKGNEGILSMLGIEDATAQSKISIHPEFVAYAFHLYGFSRKLFMHIVFNELNNDTCLFKMDTAMMQRFRELLKTRMNDLDDTFEASTWYRDHWTKDRIITRVR